MTNKNVTQKQSLITQGFTNEKKNNAAILKKFTLNILK